MDGNLPPIRYDYDGPRRLRKKKPLPGQAEDNDLVQEDPEPATDAVKLKRLRTDCPGSSFKEDDVIAEEEEHSEGTLEDTAEDNDVFIPEAVLDEQEEESSEDDYDDEMSPKQKKVRFYDNIISWKPFVHYWPFVRRINSLPVDSPRKGLMMRTPVFQLKGHFL